MSVIVTANYEGETFEVEIFHDGTIEFPGRDFQYDQACAEFAPTGPSTVRLYELWKEKPYNVIFQHFDLPENSQSLLVADYAERVLPIFEHKFPDDLRPRAAIESARDFVAGKIDLSTLKEARAAAAGRRRRRRGRRRRMRRGRRRRMRRGRRGRRGRRRRRRRRRGLRRITFRQFIIQ